jgi:hypothetical protein
VRAIPDAAALPKLDPLKKERNAAAKPKAAETVS